MARHPRPSAPLDRLGRHLGRLPLLLAELLAEFQLGAWSGRK